MASIRHVNAQIPPVHSEFVMPTYTGVGGVVFHPTSTSAYSYFRVGFKMDALGTIQKQNLYVYSWSGGNTHNSGIAWIRRDPLTEAVIDTGYFNLPTQQSSHEVGLLQDEDSNVYVVVSYIDHLATGAAKVNLHRFLFTGVDPFPVASYNIRFEDAIYGSLSHSAAHRITMDCQDLHSVAFAWDEDEIGIENPGGIYTTAGTIVGASLQLGESARISTTDEFCVAPDVAIGGDSVYISFIRKDTLIAGGSIEVISDHFSNIALGTLDLITSFSNVYTSAPLATKLVAHPQNNHIRIDAPDDVISPVWTLVYLTDQYLMNTVTVDPSSLLRNEMFALYYPFLNDFCTPAIAYSPGGQYISLAWFNISQKRYLATKLNASGTGFISPATASTYFIISTVPNDGDCSVWGKIAFSTSQQVSSGSEPRGLFMAYSNRIITSMLEEMRTKEVRWNPASNPFMQAIEPIVTKSRIYPNPLTAQSQLSISGYQGEPVSLRVSDVLGREIWSLQNEELSQVNKKFAAVIQRLSSGTYFMTIQRNGKTETIKCIKN